MGERSGVRAGAGIAPTPTIRAAAQADVDRLLPMYEWLFESPGDPPVRWDPGRARERLSRAIDSPDAAVLVAEGRDELVGLCTAYLTLDSVRYGKRCWVEDLVVAPARRSEGIGLALLDAARAWAKERGATHLELEAAIARRDAQRFYERQAPAGKGFSYSWLL